MFCMDNLKLMGQIPDNSIDLIYIDPPFSTGRTFKTKDGELAYEDKYTLEELIDFLMPRIKEIHRILKNTGTFYLHGDCRFIPYIRVECDKIFGIENFRNEIIWSYGGQSRKNDISNKHDTILRYSKSNSFTYNTQYKPYTEKTLKEFRHTDEETGKKYCRTCRRDKEGNKVYYKTFLGEGACINDVWEIGHLTQSAKERTGYPTQKPKKLLETIIKASSNEGDIVADFFCGSGSTLDVAKELGRSYIGCDTSEKAVEITKNRLEGLHES